MSVVRVRSALFFALCGLVLMLLPLATGNASVLPGTITGVKVEQTTANQYQAILVDITFAIPAGAKTGDTFSLNLPSSLTTQNQSFPVLAPDGSVVANAVVKNGVVTFTTTDYVEKFQHVTGTAKLQAHFTQGQIHPGTSNDFDFTSGGQDFHNPVFITGILTVHNSPHKIGFWTHPEDQGVTNATDAASWRVQSWAGPLTNLKFVDTLGAGQKNDCTLAHFSIASSTTFKIDGSLKNPQPLGDRAVLVCNRTTFTVTVATVNPGEVVQIDYFTTITDQSEKSFTNLVKVTARARSRAVGWGVAHYAASGEGIGINLATASTTVPSTTPTTTTVPSTAPTTTAQIEAETTSIAPVVATTAPTLPFTGSRTAGMSEAGGLLLLIGGGLLLLGRRRRGLHQL